VTDGVRVTPFGDAALLVELGGATGVEAARRARAVAAAVDAIRREVPGFGVPVPAATSVLVPFDPRALLADEVESRLAAALTHVPSAGATPPDPPLHELPVRYGGDDGPDLASVAEEIGRSPADVIALHAATTYEVLFLGFAPGFAYLGELPAPLVVPRLATPRPRVPAGSVAIAGSMTAVYPHASPGGWRLLGRTDARLFDPGATPPARLRPGDRVRFLPA
jgi:KipI family sensor histidine kinase inhibitor